MNNFQNETKTHTVMNYITPTKDNPTFVLKIANEMEHTVGYKDTCVEINNSHLSIVPTFELSYAKAMIKLMEYIDDDIIDWIDDQHKVEILMVDGSVKNDQINFKKVYSITGKQIKQRFK